MAETEEKKEDALDPRFKTRQEAELASAHFKINEQNEALERLRREKVSVQSAINRELYEANVGLRQELLAADREIRNLRANEPDRRARIEGLEAELADSEAKAARLEAELDRYRAANERVHGSSHVLDLLGV